MEKYSAPTVNTWGVLEKMSHFLTRTAAAACAAGLALTLMNGAQAATTEGTTADAADMPAIDWSKGCPDLASILPPTVPNPLGGLDCGVIDAPLDYSKPNGETTKVFFSKRAADDQAAKVGTIFINPGGPGGSGALSLSTFVSWVNDDVLRTYDIIGIDPRGVGLDFATIGVNPGAAEGVDLFDCGAPSPDQLALPFFPFQPGQAADLLKNEEQLRKTCVNNPPRIAEYMTTADLARDIDFVSRAVGDEKINYLGISYGSYLGVTLTNMFPERMGRTAIFSSIDPLQWTYGYGDDGMRTPAFGRVGSTYGAKRAWEAAFTECEKVGKDVCPQAETIRDDWAYFHAEGPKSSGFAVDGLSYQYDSAVFTLLGGAYSREGMANNLAMISKFADALRAPADERAAANLTPAKVVPPVFAPTDVMQTKATANGASYPWLAQSTMGVLCSESRNPADVTSTVTAGNRLAEVVAGEGTARTWQGSVCAQWPFRGKNAYMGPFTKPLAQTALLVNNDYDTATPLIEGAQKLNEQMANSTLVTVKEGFGHSPAEESQCVRDILNAYLLDGTTPADGTTCSPDKGLFEK